MTGTALWALQSGIFATLDADATLDSLCNGRAYDEPPQPADYPYVLVGDQTEVPDDAFGRQGRECTSLVHIYSAYSGAKEALAIAEAVADALDDATGSSITVAGYDVVCCRHEGTTIAVEQVSDGTALRHAVVSFRVWLEEQ